jgi:hypothetical protein
LGVEAEVIAARATFRRGIASYFFGVRCAACRSHDEQQRHPHPGVVHGDVYNPRRTSIDHGNAEHANR